MARAARPSWPFRLPPRRSCAPQWSVAPRALTFPGNTYLRKQRRDTRSVARICARARVTGVAFFDFPHGRTGVAPNGIELHPILGFACLTRSPELWFAGLELGERRLVGPSCFIAAVCIRRDNKQPTTRDRLIVEEQHYFDLRPVAVVRDDHHTGGRVVPTGTSTSSRTPCARSSMPRPKGDSFPPGATKTAQRSGVCAWQESNLRPRAPEARALSPELQARVRPV